MAKRLPLNRPVLIKEVVQGLLPPGDRDDLEMRQRIRRVWEAIVPAALLARTRLVEVRRKELWVEVSGSAWGQELQFLKPEVLAELDRVLGPGKIREVRIRMSGKF